MASHGLSQSQTPGSECNTILTPGYKGHPELLTHRHLHVVLAAPCPKNKPPNHLFLILSSRLLSSPDRSVGPHPLLRHDIYPRRRLHSSDHGAMSFDSWVLQSFKSWIKMSPPPLVGFCEPNYSSSAHALISPHPQITENCAASSFALQFSSIPESHPRRRPMSYGPWLHL